MAALRSLCLVITLMTISLFAQPISLQFMDSSEHQNVNSQHYESGWKILANPVHTTYQFSEATGIIHSPFGPFDPLYDSIPSGPWSKAGLKSPSEEYIYVVQSSSTDLEVLSGHLIAIGISIIDYIPDESLIVRLPEQYAEESIRQIEQIQEVRWLGSMPTMWKVHSGLIPLMDSVGIEIDLDITPSTSLTSHEISSLSNDLGQLYQIGQTSHYCDLHICQLRSADPSMIALLASDTRIMKIEPGPILSIQNSNASVIGGLIDALSISGSSLTGEGEVIGISDTGLDADHGDFEGRLRNPIYNLFGPDNSGADANSGHGTHVTATLLGDGSGDSNATGMVPEATFHFYQLEVDSSGLLARWGSLYEMFQHSLQNDANIQTNSWGSENLVGQYSSDSRSADSFSYDNPGFLIIFSAGDMAESGVTPPSTAKNVLSVGATTTGAFGSDPTGDVAGFSSNGPTVDGRIKPDLVAPGVLLCSARAEEASFAVGGNCSDATHEGNSIPLYMTLNGSSMAAPVVAGAAAMARQYLREEVGIPNPGSDLIRALLINGADDLGNPDVPNPREGWGQINLSNSLYPQKEDQNLTVFFDSDRQILPGHSFIYTFEMSEGAGFDATLAWNDREGSASADQNASRLVSDLDLKIIAPDGTVYMGNNFANGFSVEGGNRDQLNNLERVKLASTQLGIWTVQIGHSGGFAQDYTLLLSAIGEEKQEPDLTVIQNSIYSSDLNPLQGDTISIQLSWSNQAAAPTGQYSITLEDISEGSVIRDSSMTSLNGGAVESFSLYHSFASTGQHVLRLTLDHLSEVDELNDEISGINNNVLEVAFEVTQIGVRITPLMEDGTLPSDFEETAQAQTRDLDPSTASWVNFQLELRNEGTSEITVDLTVSPVQIVDESGILDHPQDEWWRLLNESGPWILSPLGESGDRVIVTLNLSDHDADISDTSEARYALPGIFVTDLTLYDKMAPTIYHSIRLSVDVARVEGLYTIAAGTEGLGAEPGEFALFTLSVKNIGNGPTQYSISCDSPDRWPINIGNSQSSVFSLGPLSRLQFVPVPIRVRVPPSSSGLPAGATELVSCVTTSVNDPMLQTTEEATVEVFESKLFTTEIFDLDGNSLGPIAISDTRAVVNGDLISTSLSLRNVGNMPLQFEVKALCSSNTWPIQVYLADEDPPSEEIDYITLQVQPDENVEIIITTIVPLAASKGERNTITIKTTMDSTTVSNGTVLEVKEITTLDIERTTSFSIAMGSRGYAEIDLHNSGNIPLSIELTLGSLPEGWLGGFLTGKLFSMDMNRDSVVSVELELPGQIESGLLSEKVPVIIESTSPSGTKEVQTVDLEVTVLPSIWIKLESETTQLQGLEPGTEGSFTVLVSNQGNVATGVSLAFGSLEGWDMSLDPPLINDLGVGDSVIVNVLLFPKASSDEGFGLRQLHIFANSTASNGDLAITDSYYEVEVSKSRSSNNGGIAGVFDALGLPTWTLATIFLLALSGLVFLGVRMRETYQPIRKDEEIIPRGSALQAGNEAERRAAALDTSTPGEVITGDVSSGEIQDALEATLPALPIHRVPEGAAPLPHNGLPEGWTMEQWVAYGHIWWEQNGP